MLVVEHPWRSTPNGDLTLLLDPDQPKLRLGFLSPDADPSVGDPVEPEKLLGVFTLHQSPDDRAAEAAETVAQLLAETKPAWLEDRVLDLLNNIHGFGTSRNPRGAAGRMGMDHPLAPLGLWGPAIGKIQRTVRKGRFNAWEELHERLEPMVWQSIEEALPGVLYDDLLGQSAPSMLLREPL